VRPRRPALRDVDQHPRRPQRREHAGIDRTGIVRARCGGEEQHVALRSERGQVRDEPPRHRLRRPRGVEQLAGKGCRTHRDGATDRAEAVDADAPPRCPPGERHRPAALADRSVVAHDVALDRQPQADGEVGDVVGQHVGGDRQRDATRGKRRPVDPVVPDAMDRDDLQRGQPVEQRRIDPHRATADQRPHPVERRMILPDMDRECALQRGRERGGQGREREDVDHPAATRRAG